MLNMTHACHLGDAIWRWIESRPLNPDVRYWTDRSPAVLADAAAHESIAVPHRGGHTRTWCHAGGGPSPQARAGCTVFAAAAHVQAMIY